MNQLARLTLLTSLIAAPAWAQDDPEGEEATPSDEAVPADEATPSEEAAPADEAASPLMTRPGADEDEPAPEGDEAELPPPAPKKEKAPKEASTGGPFSDKPSFEPANPTLRLWLAGGGGFVAPPVAPDTAPDLGGRASGGFNLGASYGINDMLRVGADITERFYSIEYVSTTPSLDGSGNQRIDTRERLQDLQLGAWFDLLEVLPMDWLSRHMRAEISLAPRWVHLDSRIFGNWSGALRGGLDLVIYPAEGLHFSAGAATAPRLFGRTDSLAIQGHPVWFNDYRAAIGLDFGEDPRWEVDLGWRADTVVFEHDYRTMHQVQLGVQLAL